MKSLRFLDRRVGFSVGALGMLLGMVAPAVVPAFASADQVTSRSIQMSSSTPDEPGVSYRVTFTPASTEPDVVLWFCSDSPLVGQTCAAPSGLNLSSATVTGPGGTPTEAILTAGSYAGAGTNYIVFNGSSMTAGDPYTVIIGNVHNPDGTDLTSTNGTFYGRIETFVDDTHAELAGGDAAHTGNIDGHITTGIVDDGGVALAVNSSISVTAAVRESMTFCVFGDNGSGTGAPDAGCDDTSVSGGPYAASLNLGEDQGDGTKALETSNVSTGEDWAQLSTNATKGAVVYLQNNNSCGGLSDDNGSTCHIPGVNGSSVSSDFTHGTANFGLKVGAGQSAGTGSQTANPTGTILANSGYSFYNLLGSGAAVSGTDANGTGLVQDTTSTYGGYIFGSSGAPIADKDVPLTFAATIGNSTPAGLYKATLNLVAVGTF